jgi:DNA polymerase-3 subunit epsilon
MTIEHLQKEVENHPLFQNLKKPIIFFDIESTGLTIGEDRIIDLSYIKITVDRRISAATYIFNPERPISAEAFKLNKYTDEYVKDFPRFADKALELLGIFSNCDLCGANVSWDLAMLSHEFNQTKILYPVHEEIQLIDVLGIYKNKEKRNLDNFYHLMTGERHVNAHNSEEDTKAAFTVLMKSIEKWDLPHDVSDLAVFSSRVDSNLNMGISRLKNEIKSLHVKYQQSLINTTIRFLLEMKVDSFRFEQEIKKMNWGFENQDDRILVVSEGVTIGIRKTDLAMAGVFFSDNTQLSFENSKGLSR